MWHMSALRLELERILGGLGGGVAGMEKMDGKFLLGINWKLCFRAK